MEMETNQTLRFDFVNAGKLGLLGSIVAIYMCFVGLIGSFADRDIIEGGVTFGLTLLFLTALGFGYATARRAATQTSPASRTLHSVLGSGFAGLLIGVSLSALVLVAEAINLRAVFINISPDLIELLTFGKDTTQGIVLLLISGTVVGILGGLVALLPAWLRNSLLLAMSLVIVVGLLRDILRVVVTGQKALVPVSDFLFASAGMTQKGALGLFLVTFGLAALWALRGRTMQARIQKLPARQQNAVRWTGIALSVLLLLILPHVLRSYLSNVVDTVGLYILMGLGLNIVVGFAGLLDLGYVAFFAIGAYTMGVLTTTSPELGGVGMSFWAALPISIGASVLAGIILGVPVLNMRGDYLAIVTLGFGEIVRILALSNWLRPFIGGAQGILPIPRPVIFGRTFDSFQALYYLILLGCVIAFVISWRLRESRLGRSWMAMREDEDVAEAMGMNLVSTKLLAFATGAAFAGASGAIFASQVSSIFPHSFDLLRSINVLCIVIVGGMGSLPGVIVGSLFLVGLPEILSELQEFRLLFYGAALVLVMLARPEGLWPESTRKRELHEGAAAGSELAAELATRED
jgi:branched-chain amino acid transport system permease protein